MDRQNIRKYIINELKNANVDENDINAETNFILENFLGIKNFYELIECPEEKLIKLKEIFEKRKQHIPLQYILNIADFMGEKFFVNKNTLIPRPETEFLVLEAINIAKNFEKPKILDIGSGSGCISIMLKKKIINAEIFSCDISKEALKIAKKNANKLNAEITFIHSDLFSNINNKFDIIVSNPPYIPPQEKATIQKEVLFEPDLALYTADKNGVEFYEKIISQAKNFLNSNGFVLFELGINQSDIVKNIFSDYNFSDIKIIKDLDGIDRIISAKVQNG